MDQLNEYVAKLKEEVAAEEEKAERAKREIEVERVKLEKVKKALVGVSEAVDGKIRLNVGGRYFDTSKETLVREESSVLATIASGRWKPDDKGAFFIDRDPALFEYILDYLRNGRMTHKLTPELENRVRIEADFFSLTELKKILCTPVFLIKEKWRMRIRKWLESNATQLDFAIHTVLQNGATSFSISKSGVSYGVQYTTSAHSSGRTTKTFPIMLSNMDDEYLRTTLAVQLLHEECKEMFGVISGRFNLPTSISFSM